MLDKSIPYKNIIMKLPAQKAASLEVPPLPAGWRFRMFAPGDEKAGPK